MQELWFHTCKACPLVLQLQAYLKALKKLIFQVKIYFLLL